VLCPGAPANETKGCDLKRQLFPQLTATTVCGNGTKEAYEGCDNGAANHNSCQAADAGNSICTTACVVKDCPAL
jgi:hypothetical protein